MAKISIPLAHLPLRPQTPQ